MAYYYTAAILKAQVIRVSPETFSAGAQQGGLTLAAIASSSFSVRLDIMEATRTVLVTGATGYIGGRLVPRLLEAGFRVRCLARDPARLQGRPWLTEVAV